MGKRGGDKFDLRVSAERALEGRNEAVVKYDCCSQRMAQETWWSTQKQKGLNYRGGRAHRTCLVRGKKFCPEVGLCKNPPKMGLGKKKRLTGRGTHISVRRRIGSNNPRNSSTNPPGRFRTMCGRGKKKKSHLQRETEA